MTRAIATFALCLVVLPLSATPISPEIHKIVLDIGASLGVPRSVSDRLQIEESGDPITGEWGYADAIGPVDCYGSQSRGLYQISTRWESYLVGLYYPHPAKYFDWSNPIDNATVALGYLSDLHRRLGTWERALWFYNCGRVTDVPENTQKYAQRIIDWPEEAVE